MSVKMEPIDKSCGNVFADLGLEDAEELQAKAIMAVAILKIIKHRKLTQASAAELSVPAKPILASSSFIL